MWILHLFWSTTPLGDKGQGIAVLGNLVYVAASTKGIDVFDVSDPANPTLVRNYDTAVAALGVAVAGDYIYVADSFGGLEVLHWLDMQPPTVAFTNPTPGPTYTTTNGLLNIGGSSGDNVGVIKITWANNRGGGGTAQGTGSWSVNGVQLAPGVNVITVTAVDAAGNVSTTTLTVTYTLLIRLRRRL